MTDEIIAICVVCNQKIEKGKLSAKKIDGLWVCGLGCMDKFFEEKKKWRPENWGELCKLQAFYEERKRTEKKQQLLSI